MAPTERAKELRETAKRGPAADQYASADQYAFIWEWDGVEGYYHGLEGLQENKWMAAALFRKAAARGHAQSHTFLGLMYSTGEGVEQNMELAVSWAAASLCAEAWC